MNWQKGEDVIVVPGLSDEQATEKFGSFDAQTPYLRVVPMHLTIIIGGAIAGSQMALAGFLTLKTLADYLMHRLEHAMMRKSQETGAKRGRRS